MKLVSIIFYLEPPTILFKMTPKANAISFPANCFANLIRYDVTDWRQFFRIGMKIILPNFFK